MRGECFETELDEQIVFNQLDADENAVWSLLLATGYLKVERLERRGRLLKKFYGLRLTNMEVESMFEKMIRGWFAGGTRQEYNGFIQALLTDDVEAMNEFMNKIALKSFSAFDIAKSASGEDEPERFYHGFVLGLMAELSEQFTIRSNRESGFGCYDVMLCPIHKEKDNAYIIEFKVFKPGKEKNLEETVNHALPRWMRNGMGRS